MSPGTERAGLAIVDEPGHEAPKGTLTTTSTEAVGVAIDKLPDETKAAPPQHQKGFRHIGPKKGKLLLKISDELQRLHRKGINAKFVLEKFTDFKNGITTPTKNLTGILSQLKSFDK
jgi:hypothetical protein